MSKHFKKISFRTFFILAIFLLAGCFALNQAINFHYAYGPNAPQVAGAVTSTAMVPPNVANIELEKVEEMKAVVVEQQKKLAEEQTQWQQDYEKQKNKLALLIVLTAALFLLSVINFYLDSRKEKGSYVSVKKAMQE